LNRQTTLSPILFPAEMRSLELLLKHFDAVKQVVDDGGSIREIRKLLGCRYSEAAELLTAVAVLEDKFP